MALLYETNRPEISFSEQCRSLLGQVARDVLPRDVRGNGVQLGSLTAKFIWLLGNECLAHKGVLLDQRGRSDPQIYLSVARTRTPDVRNEPNSETPTSVLDGSRHWRIAIDVPAYSASLAEVEQGPILSNGR